MELHVLPRVLLLLVRAVPPVHRAKRVHLRFALGPRLVFVPWLFMSEVARYLPLV